MKDQQPFSGAQVILIPELSRRTLDPLLQRNQHRPVWALYVARHHSGDYKLFAWETVEEGAYRSPDFLRSYEDRGQAVHVDEGNHSRTAVAVDSRRVKPRP